jgi:hypothetical protein
VRVLAASVLAAEAFVIFFATIVAANLSEDVSTGTAWAVGGGFSLAFLAMCGLLRYRWAYPLGWGLQLALVASGVVVTAMFFLGAVFTGLWFVALRYGRKVDAVKAARAAG